MNTLPEDRALAGTACIAVALPALIAFNVPPSATIFNQVAAFVGWGAFLLVVGVAVPRGTWPRSRASQALLAALGVLLLAALASPFWAASPWPLSLSASGTIASALLAVTVAACAERAGLGGRAFRAVCIALVVAGLASSVIGLVQVFAPRLPDGNWIALPALPGRASGNLRQPNHLSSLLLWSIVAAVWLGEAEALYRKVAALLAVVFIYVIVLSASRTGALGMLTLALWGVLDRRLSRRARTLLIMAPIVYGACWWGMTVWANASHHLFGGQTRFGGSGDISSSRFAIWSNTLALIRSHPWFGVGFGEFNFAWTLTPFPNRPVAFFDHTHNLILNFLVELGIPLATLVVALLSYALWKALGHALADGREAADGHVPVQRAAFVMVVMVGVHSMLEYPLWYAYFLLPTAFAFGLCLERPDARETALAAAPPPNVTRPLVLASMLLILGGMLTLLDYSRVVVIFSPPARATPLEQRIAEGRHSILFGHHADYAAATVAEHPGLVMKAFQRAPHFLLDARLMMAWARALEENGEDDKARYVAARLKEFRNDQAEAFFEPCAAPAASGAAPGWGGAASAAASRAVPASPVARGRGRPASAAAKAGDTASTATVAASSGVASAAAAASAVAGAASAPPFQCLAPKSALRFEDFR